MHTMQNNSYTTKLTVDIHLHSFFSLIMFMKYLPNDYVIVKLYDDEDGYNVKIDLLKKQRRYLALWSFQSF